MQFSILIAGYQPVDDPKDYSKTANINNEALT